VTTGETTCLRARAATTNDQELQLNITRDYNHFPSSSNGPGTHRFVPTSVNVLDFYVIRGVNLRFLVPFLTGLRL